MLTEQQLTQRLTRAVDRVEVEFSVEDVIQGRRAPVASRSVDAPEPLARRLVAAAALFLVVGLVTALAIRAGGRERTAADDPPVTPAQDAPEPGSLAPHVTDVPASVGEIGAARRVGGQRTGRWVGVALARTDANGYQAPIAVFATTGSWSALASASPITIDDRAFVTTAFGGLTILATTGTPQLIATGRVEPSDLAEILASVQTTRVGDIDVPRVGQVPPGYVEIVAPTVLGNDVADRRSLANAAGTLSINEVSDMADGLLAAATTGSDLERAQVGGRVAWLGRSEVTGGSARFLIWSPTSGVIVEIDITDDGIPTSDLLDLASRTTMVDIAEWDRLHQT